MAAPYRHIVIGKPGFFGRMLGKKRSSPADEVNNLLAAARDVRDVTKERVTAILVRDDADMNSLTRQMVPLFQRFIKHVLADAELDPTEILQLRHLQQVLMIPAKTAQETLNTVGYSIYLQVKEEAQRDGVIDATEKAKLGNLKKALGLKVEVPEEGLQWEVMVQRCVGTVNDKKALLNSLATNFKAVQDGRPDVYDHLDLDSDLADIDLGIDLLDEIIEEASELEKDDQEGLMELIERIDQVDMETPAEKLSKAVELSKGPEIDPEQAWEDEKRQNQARAAKLGFKPSGSPKQKSWAYDIICRDFLDTELGEQLEKAIKSPTDDQETQIKIKYMALMRKRSAGWWINTYDIVAIDREFKSFRKEELAAT